MTSEGKARPPEGKGLSKSAPFWHLDREMLKFKIHFFLFSGAFSSAAPFMAVFAKTRIGLAPSTLGAAVAANMFLNIFSRPLIGYIADYFNRLKSIIVVLTLTFGSGYFLLLTIPEFEREPSTTFNRTVFHSCDDLLKLRELEASFAAEDIGFVETGNETAICHQCLHCTLNASGPSVPKPQKPFWDSYHHWQQHVTIDNEKRIAVMCYKNDSIVTTVCSCALSSHLKNFTSECVKLVCPNVLNTDQTDAGLQNSSANFSLHSTNIAEALRPCSFQNASTNSKPDQNPKHVSDFQTAQFWIFAFVLCVTGVCAQATITLSDTACCESIQKTGADFGKQRLWGAVGWGLAAPIAGLLNDSSGDFLGSWILMAVMLLLFLWNLSNLDLVKPHFSKNILADVGTVLKSKEFLAFEVVIFVNGVSIGVVWLYLIWFLTSIGGSEFLCGMTIAVEFFCGAIPFMFFSGLLIRKVGCFRILMAVLLTKAAIFLWYSYLYDPWWVLPIQVSHGATIGLYYTVQATYGKKSSKPGTEATTQAVLSSTHDSLGAGMGCVLEGIGFDRFGGHETYFLASVFCACGFIVSIVLFLAVIRQKRVDETTATNQPVV